ncbi:MAG: hypothetical protein LRY43_04025 [Gammaproteobacteria bacterium]|nr:hypothetical protein [Gammaproteobacteria bacterium]
MTDIYPSRSSYLKQDKENFSSSGEDMLQWGRYLTGKKMKRITPLLLTILLITSAPSILASNFPLSILDDVQTTSDPQSSNSLGLGFAYGQNIYTGVDNIIQPFPLFNLSMHNFFLKGDELGYYTYKRSWRIRCCYSETNICRI